MFPTYARIRHSFCGFCHYRVVLGDSGHDLKPFSADQLLEIIVQNGALGEFRNLCPRHLPKGGLDNLNRPKRTEDNLFHWHRLAEPFGGDEPLREVGREVDDQIDLTWALVVHDWSKLDYGRHTSQRDTV